MAEQTIISWNVPNWVTVVLMVMVGFFVLGLVGQIWQSKMGGGS